MGGDDSGWSKNCNGAEVNSLAQVLLHTYSWALDRLLTFENLSVGGVRCIFTLWQKMRDINSLTELLLNPAFKSDFSVYKSGDFQKKRACSSPTDKLQTSAWKLCTVLVHLKELLVMHGFSSDRRAERELATAGFSAVFLDMRKPVSSHGRKFSQGVLCTKLGSLVL